MITIKKLSAKFLFRKPIVVVEIGGDSFKVLKNSWMPGGRRVTYIKIVKFIDIKEAGDILSNVFKTAKLNRRQVIFCIPRNLATVRILQLPSTDSKEIGEIINLQVSKQTPYTKEEIISAYKLLEIKDGYANVLLVIVKRDIIMERLEVLKRAGVKTDKLTISLEGVCNWFNFVYTRGARAESLSSVILLDIDSGYSDFIVMRGGNLVFTRAILIGANHLASEKKPQWDKFIEELKYSLDIYQQEKGSNKADKIILSGADLSIDGLGRFVSEGLNLPVETAAIGDGVRTSLRADILADEKMKSVSITAILGSAVKYKELEIDLTPNELRIKKLIEKKRKKLTITGVLVISIIMTASFLLLTNIYEKTTYLSQLKQKINSLRKESDEVEKMRLGLDLIVKRKDAEMSSLNILNELYNLIPNEVFLNSINIEEGNNVVLKGSAYSLSDVFKFITKLENTHYFMNVKNTYATSRKEKDAEYTDFEIIGVIERGRK